MTNAIGFLVQSQNTDGGWGYRGHGMSFVEPTAAVLFVLSGQVGAGRGLIARGPRDQVAISASELDAVMQRGRAFLAAQAHRDGGWGIGAIDDESGWMTAWAVLALAPAQGQSEPVVTRGVEWLLKTAGARVTDPDGRAQIRDLYRMDSTLTGWPWQPNDGAWVHPTSLAILALAAAGRRDAPRVAQGVAYLVDRAVATGGWNIGNPEMLGKRLPATIQDSAVALLALAVAPLADAECCARGTEFLSHALETAKTPAELAWGLVALRAWNVDAGNALARLNELEQPEGDWQGNPFTTAIALWANPI